MADIKFMDISENNNPATTDSILVGNKDNGLKRTSLGNLADMFGVHKLFHFEQVSSVLVADTFRYPIQAPDVEGYKFAFWLQSATVNCTINSYIDYPIGSSATIWFDNNEQTEFNRVANGTNTVRAIAVYVRNSVA